MLPKGPEGSCAPQVRVLPLNWVLALKRDEEGRVTKAKARLVADGSRQPEYLASSAKTLNQAEYRSMMATAVERGMYIGQCDVSNAYIQAELDDDVYVEQPYGLGRRDKDVVFKLKRSLYGLRQSGANWYRTLTEYLEKKGYHSIDAEPCILRRKWRDEGHPNGPEQEIICGIFVDDCCVIATQESHLELFFDDLRERFEIRNETEPNGGWFLSIHYEYNDARTWLRLSQTAAIEALAAKFELRQSGTQGPYQI